MPTTLIQADDVFSVTAAIFAIIAFGAWSERTPIGRSISGAMVAILIAAALANFDVLPATSPVYNVVWQYLVPIAIALFLIKADLVSVFTEGGRVLIAFLFGAVGVVIGGVLGVFVLGLGEDGAKYAAIISASMTGGSLNFAAVAKALGYADMSDLAALLAIVTLFGLGFFVLLGALARLSFIQDQFAWRSNALKAELHESEHAAARKQVQLFDLAAALAIAALIVVASNLATQMLNWPGYEMLFITLFMTIVATLGRKLLSRINGEDVIAMIFMYMFFIMLGAGADVSSMLGEAPVISILIAIILAVHLAFVALAGRLFKINYGELAIASFACIGGPPIAAAFAVLLRWRNLIVPGVVTGVFGYIIGTFIGVGMFEALARIAP